MYGHNNTLYTYTSADSLGHFPSNGITAPLTFLSPPVLPPPSLIITDKFAGIEFDSVMKSEVGSSNSGCSSYGSPSSLTSYFTRRPSLIQRSVSSHSLQKNGFCPPVSAGTEFLESETGPVRRVFSTGDLQRINLVQQSHTRSESPLSNENSSIIEGMSKACRYSPEEKKERIERYRSKRTQRNFNKKIKYACRKTLADSRPRIRGRFARNEEIEKTSPSQWRQISGEEDEEEDDNWVNFIDAFSANLIP